MTKPIVGFIGLGDMGEPMAGRLLQRGYQVVSSVNRRRDAIERLKSKGIIERGHPREVAAECDIFMSIVVDQGQTDRVLRGPDGALAALRAGTTIVLMSTLAPAYCQTLAAELRHRGIDLVDCPVSGGPMGAEKATLGARMAAAYGMDMDALMAVMRAGTANSFIVQAWSWLKPMVRKEHQWR
jgi:2-hydroxy-3-oxopropionate reductase